jgi:WD40 repeat protein
MFASPGDLSSSLHILDADTSTLRTSVPLGRYPANPRQSYAVIVSYAPEGRRVIAGYRPDRSGALFLRSFDGRSGSPLGPAVRVGPSGPDTASLLSTSDGRLLYPSKDATYAIDPETLSIVRRYPVGADSAAISPDGGTLAVETMDGRLRLLDMDSGRMRTLAGRANPDSDVVGAFSPDGRTLATWGGTGRSAIWDVRKGVEIEVLEGHAEFPAGQAFSPDGRTLYTASFDGSAIVWDVAGDRRLGRSFKTGLVGIPEEEWPPGVAVSPDGRTLAVARLDGRVDLIDAETLRRTRTFEAFHRTQALAIEYSPDGRRLAVAGGRGVVGFFDAVSGERVGLLSAPPQQGPCADPRSIFDRSKPCYEANVQALAFGRTGLLAAAGVGGEVRIWEQGRSEPIGPSLHPPRFVLGLAFSPDGSQLAVTFGTFERGSNGVDVRDARSGERLARLPTDNEVRSVAFSPDGSLVAGGQVDGGTLLWETDGWRQVGSPLAVSHGATLGVAFSPDGRTLATSHDDGAVILWDVESQQPIGSPLPGPAFHYVTARFTPDGRRLFAVYNNGTAVRWEVDPDVWRQHACVVAGGGLTPEQWEEIVPEQDYISVCPSG